MNNCIAAALGLRADQSEEEGWDAVTEWFADDSEGDARRAAVAQTVASNASANWQSGPLPQIDPANLSIESDVSSQDPPDRLPAEFAGPLAYPSRGVR